MVVLTLALAVCHTEASPATRLSQVNNPTARPVTQKQRAGVGARIENEAFRRVGNIGFVQKFLTFLSEWSEPSPKNLVLSERMRLSPKVSNCAAVCAWKYTSDSEKYAPPQTKRAACSEKNCIITQPLPDRLHLEFWISLLHQSNKRCETFCCGGPKGSILQSCCARGAG